MDFSNPKEVIEAIQDRESAAEMIRQQLTVRTAIDRCYYEGVHWLNPSYRVGASRDSSTARLSVDYNPDARKLRATDNFVTYLTQKSAASTHPDEIYIDAVPPERDTGTDTLFRTRVHETAANTAIDESSLLYACQLANHRRCINGTWGVGLTMADDTRVMNGQEVPSRCVKAFEFDPANLITDPHCQHLQLHLHDWIGYTDVWTLDVVRNVLGIEIAPEDASTVEQLEPTKLDYNAISNGRLFSYYARVAKTKAVRIYQLHTKKYGYRFDRMYVAIENADKRKRLVIGGVLLDEDGNIDGERKGETPDIGGHETETPFGGTGLPLTLLHGYLRSDTMWSWGEPAQIKEVQDKANLVETNQQRIIQRYAGSFWKVDKRAFGNRPNDDDIAKVLTNQVGGIITYELGDRQRNVSPPELQQQPPPPPFLMEALSIYQNVGRDRTHKAPGNFGSTPTHVPFKTTERVLDDADQVSSVRVARDAQAVEYLVGVLHSTTLRLAQERNPGTLGMLVKAGFGEDDFAVLVQEDWFYPKVDLQVRQSSMRHQSTTSKKQNIDTAAQMQMIDAAQYQDAMADAGIDMPLTDEWRQMKDKCRRRALSVLMGQPFQPRPMGKWGQLLLDELMRAQEDRRVEQDPQALPRLVLAVQQQYDMMSQEQLMANPELRQKVAESQQAAAQGGDEGQSEQQGPQPGDSVSVADLIGALSQGGSGAGASVPASAA